MAKIIQTKKSGGFLSGALWRGLLGLVGGARPLIHQLQEDVEKRFHHYTLIIEKRVLSLIFKGSTLFISVLFVSFGFLFVLMDYANMPRAVACLFCGVLDLAVLFLTFQLSK